MLSALVVSILAVAFWIALAIVVRKFYSVIERPAHQQGPLEEGDRLEFFVTSRMLWLLRSIECLLLGFSLLIVCMGRREDGSLYATVIPLFVLFLIFAASPVPVVVDRDGIRQRRWFLPDRNIQWNDIGSIAFGENTRTTYVQSKTGGSKIRFSAYLVGRERFMGEIRAHIDGNVTSELGDG